MAKKLKTDVPQMVKNVISMVNFIKIRPLKLIEFLLFSVITGGVIMKMLLCGRSDVYLET